MSGDDPQPLSEFDLIGLFADRPADPPWLEVGIGDDASIARTRGRAVTSTDTVVEGVHFRREWSGPQQIGAKAVGTALSDLAAMGVGRADTGIWVAFGCPPGTDPELVRGVAAGVAETAARHGAALAGGDTVAAPVLMLTVTVTAHVDREEPLVERSGARRGHLVAVTGSLGGARAGLELLRDPELGDRAGLDEGRQRELLRRQLEPVPLLAAGEALAEAGASAMLDVSDGLVADLGHLARAVPEGRDPVTFRIESELVPAQPGSGEVAAAAGADRLDYALAGGEDYELAVTLPRRSVELAGLTLAGLDLPLTVIGEVVADSGTPVEVLREGRPAVPDRPGFDHFG